MRSPSRSGSSSTPLACTYIAMSFPTLQSTGTDALNDILRETISRGSIPATFIGATNARETIHFGFAGDKVYGKAEAGQVDEDTSE